ncbi:hypothetical protein BS47DRAFT_1374939 [Hydnum rufescens UP504]|uniref:CS domain-containing protein n=1 Tax=Hydnum rufescens UP504 TaxID=1448309 RepID=A0A9P6B9E7_9AGAM|nr:hypothetical protein BS47DRAFT_1374939 [Hydnum rufescens UP504]
MITPKFTCSQDDESVTVSCYMPAIRASEVELYVDSTVFTLHVHPYFLRLTFSHPLLEDDDPDSSYDPSSGFLTVRLAKANHGVVFQDLDLLSKLLAPPTVCGQQGPPLIEVLSSNEVDSGAPPSLEGEDLTEHLRKEREIFLEAERNDWHLPQTVPSDDPGQSTFATSAQRRYGFLDAYSGFFKYAGEHENEVNELGRLAETASDSVRTEMRVAHEDKKWDEEYYIADFVNDEEIQEHIAWTGLFHGPTEPIQFTEAEQAMMLKLPRKEYLISPEQNRSLYLTLITILFAHAYDMRTTQHDPTTESAWTLAILTPCMSALDISPTIPLFRSWALCERLRIDVADVLKGGRPKGIMDRSDVYYVYSKIWLDDYCLWIQSGANDSTLESLGEEVRTLTMEKSAIGWQLEQLESATRAVAAGWTPSDSDSDSTSDSNSADGPESSDSGGESAEEEPITTNCAIAELFRANR